MSLNSIFTSLNLIAERFIRKQCQLPTIFPLEEDCINQKDTFTLIVEIGRFDPCIMLVVIDSCLFVCLCVCSHGHMFRHSVSARQNTHVFVLFVNPN